MGRVIPSQIVQFIDTAFPTAKEAQEKKIGFVLNYQHIGFIGSVSVCFSS